MMPSKMGCFYLSLGDFGYGWLSKETVVTEVLATSAYGSLSKIDGFYRSLGDFGCGSLWEFDSTARGG
jgi:hypothetical protein